MHITVYTDASMSKDGEYGIGGVLVSRSTNEKMLFSRNIEFKEKLRIDALELMAIYSAVKCIKDVCHSIAIVSDNRTCVNFINNQKGNHRDDMFNKILSNLLNELERRKLKRVDAYWVKAHKSNKRNKTADKLALKARKNNKNITTIELINKNVI